MVITHILRYLLEHPDAKDTVMGVLQWWVPTHPSETSVQEALEVLVAQGWVTQRQTITSQQLYGLNKEKLEEIKAYLHGPGSQASG
jgi:hypothetical protein